MSAVKERIFGAITVMREEDAAEVWEILRYRFGFREDEATDDELKALQAFKDDEDEYRPYISHEELKNRLGD